jgi:protein-disulfide isomerase
MLESNLGYGEEYARLVAPIDESDHILGDPGAVVKIVEYGDFECPFCGAAYWKTRDFHRIAGEQLCIVFRHFPLTQAHPHAGNAAEASEIAGKAGKFWEMHNMLFENQDSLDDKSLVSYAVALGLDGDKFLRELYAHTQSKRVRADFMSGVRSGVNGTPCFFVNDVRFDGSVDELVDAVAEELNEL